ncbi:MAG: hypothetical protein IPI79_02880 [Moraxellaceae bacterium]|nr:hypothetical protein [Moraxellaceae bacterium]
MSYFLRISLCLCLWCLASLSRAAPLYIDSDFSSAPLGQSLSYYCDNTNQLSLAQVKQQPFNSLQKKKSHLALTNQVVGLNLRYKIKPIPLLI